jgi:hypothetical protein
MVKKTLASIRLPLTAMGRVLWPAISSLSRRYSEMMSRRIEKKNSIMRFLDIIKSPTTADPLMHTYDVLTVADGGIMGTSQM